MIAWLAFFPRNWGTFGEFSFEARSIAWIVLNSNFATAFSLLAVSPLLFAGAQFWRHSQARQKFLVVSGVYSAEQRAAREQKRIAAMTELQAVRSKIEALDFRSPASQPWLHIAFRRPAKYGRQAPTLDFELWDRACQAARTFAQSKPTPSKLPAIETETQRLTRYVRLPGGRSKSLADFIAALHNDGLLGVHSSHWTALAEAIRSSQIQQMNDAMLVVVTPQQE